MALKTHEVQAALRARYEPPAWAIFFEVANATGFSAKSRADAIAMSLWPSRGLELAGFEIKVSRSDWKKELDDPAKAESVFKFMDRWWVVVGDSGIVKEGELPPTWGLIVPRGTGLVTKVDAPKLEPEPLSRSFLAAVLRRAQEATVRPGEKELKDTATKAFEAGEAHGRVMQGYDFKRLKTSVDAFEAASGVRVDAWSEWESGRIGAAVKQVLRGENDSVLRNLKEIRELGARLTKDVDALLTPLPTEETAK